MIFGLVTMPLGNLWSRWREVKADEYALKITSQPKAFISAMTRLANQNLADAGPPAWIETLQHSHPSISKRVAVAQLRAAVVQAAPVLFNREATIEKYTN